MEMFWEFKCDEYMETDQFNEPSRVCYVAAFGTAYGFTTEEEWTRFKEAFENNAEDEANDAANVIVNNWKTGKQGLSIDDDEVVDNCYAYNMKNTIADFVNENECFR